MGDHVKPSQSNAAAPLWDHGRGNYLANSGAVISDPRGSHFGLTGAVPLARSARPASSTPCTTSAQAAPSAPAPAAPSCPDTEVTTCRAVLAISNSSSRLRMCHLADGGMVAPAYRPPNGEFGFGRGDLRGPRSRHDAPR